MYKRLVATKASNSDFHTHTTALWPVKQSSILSDKFDCPVARQKFSLLATAHECETGFYTLQKKPDSMLLTLRRSLYT